MPKRVHSENSANMEKKPTEIASSSKMASRQSSDQGSGNDTSDSDSDTFPLDNDMPKEVENSKTTHIVVMPPSSGRKRSVRKLSVENLLCELPFNDDVSELIEEQAQSEKAKASKANAPVVHVDITTEQMEEHVSQCLQLNTENKINTKNAFGLQLIDYLPILTRNVGEKNFTAMACQLDAGAKIYAHRVDAVHNQVMKLVETCLFAERKTSKKKANGDDEADSGTEKNEEGTSSNTEKVKKKKIKKKVIATADQITRKPKEKDPREMFVKLEAVPGDILTKAKHVSSDLSLTLDKHIPFWMDRQQFKPVKATGSCEVEDIITNNRSLGPALKLDPDINSMFLTSNLHKYNEDYDAEPDEPVDFDDEEENEVPVVDDNLEAKKRESEIVFHTKFNTAMKQLNASSKTNVMKVLLHDPEDNEYDYLNTDNVLFWAGPTYWKRSHGLNSAANKKKNIRKKKDPCEINYENVSAQSIVGKGTKRKSVLKKYTLSKWAMKKVTLPPVVHIEPKCIYNLFYMSASTRLLADSPTQEEEYNEPPPHNEDEPENEHNSLSDDEGAQADNELESQVDFSLMQLGIDRDVEYGFPSSSSCGPSSSDLPLNTSQTPGGDAYEGDNLVPMVKMVKVDPIKCVAKPNRVNMQHLKNVMLTIILQAIEDEENQPPGQDAPSQRRSVLFRDVLSKLFNTDMLHYRTRQDLTVSMAFLCLLTLANENEFSLVKENDDVVISRSSGKAPTNPEAGNQETRH